MSLKDSLKRIRDTYVIRQVQNVNLPKFTEENIHRYRISFRGRVQKVGFRLEITELANRLGLTGSCRNLENGAVLAELQGPDDKIWYLVSFMESLKRIKIREKEVRELEVDPEETAFVQVRE